MIKPEQIPDGVVEATAWVMWDDMKLPLPQENADV